MNGQVLVHEHVVVRVLCTTHTRMVNDCISMCSNNDVLRVTICPPNRVAKHTRVRKDQEDSQQCANSSLYDFCHFLFRAYRMICTLKDEHQLGQNETSAMLPFGRLDVDSTGLLSTRLRNSQEVQSYQFHKLGFASPIFEPKGWFAIRRKKLIRT